jgi:hypothetical protein
MVRMIAQLLESSHLATLSYQRLAYEWASELH